MEDVVNNPSHYTQGNIEVIDFLIDQNFDYIAGNIVKYICRYRYKGNPVQDLRKAKYYLDRLIEIEEYRAPDPRCKKFGVSAPAVCRSCGLAKDYCLCGNPA